METKKEQNFIEDDDDIPELRSDDEDSDDEDNYSTKHQHWRLSHNEAARATASTNSHAISQSQATSSQARSESSNRAREKSTNYQPDNNLIMQPALHSANTLHTADTQKPPSLQNPNAKPSAVSDRTQLSIQNLWHQRLDHPNNRRLREMAANPIYIARGFPALTKRQLDMHAVCDSCMLGKSHTITSHKEIYKGTIMVHGSNRAQRHPSYRRWGTHRSGFY